VKGGSLSGDVLNKIKYAARAAKANQANLRAASVALADLEATLVIGDVLATAVLLHAAATDAAIERIDSFEDLVCELRSQGRLSDSAIAEGVRQARTELGASTGSWGAVVTAINQQQGEILAGSVSLAAALFHVPHAWAFLGLYKTVAGIVDQEHQVQGASLLLGLLTAIDASSPTPASMTPQELDRLLRYGEISFHRRMETALSTGVASIRNTLDPSHHEASTYHRDLCQRLLDSSFPCLTTTAHEVASAPTGEPLH